ncbi:hypothetical protein L218DRAFT_953416 [Marasmius fiardii PR-910]|nr:hypothetical protein L218DRAFT_953416 [Marasmius fiardii PR-910]
MACSFFTRLLGLILFCIPSALAGVYITEPWAGTKWTACRCHTLSWRDNYREPHLSEMVGPAVAELYTKGGDYTASVEIDDINDGEVVVCLPDPCEMDYPDSRDYQVRINADNLTYWSHSFPITNTRCLADVCDTHHKHPQAFVAAESAATISEPTTKSSPAFSESYLQINVSPVITSSLSSGVLQSKPSVPTASTVFADPLNTPHQPTSFGLQKNRNSASNRFIKSGHWLDSEKIKFHLVFIVWPALVGISMSL